MSEMDLFKMALAKRKERQALMIAQEGMERTILSELEEIERRENIRILHCVESGSRAWGFASPDSDYDVRFIYVRPKEHYLRLDETRDVIRWQLDDTLDISGWDVKKVLTHLHRSDPTLFEWSLSPIVYKTTEEWQRICSVVNRYFLAGSGLHHYLGTATSNYRDCLQGDVVRYKKYFYVLRPLLACKWILDKGTPPPVDFGTLMDAYLDKELVPDVQRLLELKTTAPPIIEGAPIEKVNEYIERTIKELEGRIDALPPPKNEGWAELNSLFLEIILGNDRKHTDL